MKLNTKLLIPSFISALMVVAVFLQITYGACNPPEKMDCCIEQITTNITKQAEINLIPQEPQCVCMPIDAPSLEICAGVEVNINQAAEIEYLHKLIPNPNIAGAICLNTQQLRRVKTVVPELNTQWNVRNETFSTNGIGTVACVTVTNSGIYSFTFSVTAEDPAIIDSVSTVQTTITVRPMDEMPFYEPFTNDLFYMQGLHGVNGWAVNPPDKAADAKVFADSITNGILCVSPGGAPMSIQHLSCVDFEEGTNVPSIIYQEFMANFPLIDAPEPPFFVPDNTPAYFYLNAEGEVVFFQGGIDGGEWVTVSDGRKIPADTWVHYLLELDFTNQRWGLWLDGEPEIRYVPFSRPTKFYIGINWPLYPLENYWWEWGWSKDAWYHWWRGWRWQWRWWRWWWYMPFYYDYDMDNMPNWWEIKHGLNPYDPADAQDDPDKDGYVNLKEFYNGTNPHVPDPCTPFLDSDHDRMPDCWEIQYGFNPANSADAYEDPDQDGLCNLMEYYRGTNPIDYDTDKDGMPNGWERAHGLPHLRPNADEDPDGDGYTNIEEFRYNTDPSDPFSHPLYGATATGQTTYSGAATGQTYVVATLLNADGSYTRTQNADASGKFKFFKLPLTVPINPKYGQPVTTAFYNLHAWLDVNANGIQDFWEPKGLFTNSNGEVKSVILNTPDSSNVSITLYDTDFDADGLPDWWEISKGLCPTNAADAMLDADNDGYTNMEEFLAGTCPTNILSHPWNIAGEVCYEGSATGSIHIIACTNNFGWDAVRQATRTGSGDFKITHLETNRVYWIKAWIDVNFNGLNDYWEPCYECPIPVLLNREQNIGVIKFGDVDNDGDSIADWWEYFYGLSPTDANDANQDLDGDGYTNLEEFLAGTDPNVATSHPWYINGILSYSGEASGPFRVISCLTNNTWEAESSASLEYPDEFYLRHLTTKGTNWLRAWCDINKNGIKDAWEPYGDYLLNPVVLQEPVTLLPLPLVLNDTDIDGDRIPDWWEVENGMSYQDANDGALDFDNDGYSNIEEFLAKTDPRNPTSHPWCISGTLAVSNTITGKIYVIASASENSWDPVSKSEVTETGKFLLKNLPEYRNYWIKAWCDSDVNGVLSGWEARGEYHSNPACLYFSYTNIQFSISDPLAPDFWWQNAENGFDGLPVDIQRLLTQNLYNTDRPWELDSDNDGLSNGDELAVYGTNPFISDTDGDGLPDGWEIYFGLDPLCGTDAETILEVQTADGSLTNVSALLLFNAMQDTDGDGLLDATGIATHIVPLAWANTCWLPSATNFALANLSASGFCQSEPSTNTSYTVDADCDGFSDTMEIFMNGGSTSAICVSNAVSSVANSHMAILQVDIDPSELAENEAWGVHMWVSNVAVFVSSANSIDGQSTARYACVPEDADPDDLKFTLASTSYSQIGKPYNISLNTITNDTAFDWVIDPERSYPLQGIYMLNQGEDDLPTIRFAKPTLNLDIPNVVKLESLNEASIAVAPDNAPYGHLILEIETTGGTIEFYDNSSCSGTPLELPFVWSNPNEFPSSIGFRATSISTLKDDIAIKVTYSNDFSQVVRSVTKHMTVIDLRILQAHRFALAGNDSEEGKAEIIFQLDGPANFNGEAILEIGLWNKKWSNASSGTHTCTASSAYSFKAKPSLRWHGVDAPPFTNEIAFVSLTLDQPYTSIRGKSDNVLPSPIRIKSTLLPQGVYCANADVWYDAYTSINQGLAKATGTSFEWDWQAPAVPLGSICSNQNNKVEVYCKLPEDHGRRITVQTTFTPLVVLNQDEPNGNNIENPYFIRLSHEGCDNHGINRWLAYNDYTNCMLELTIQGGAGSDALNTASNFQWNTFSGPMAIFENTTANPTRVSWQGSINCDTSTVALSFMAAGTNYVCKRDVQILQHPLALSPAMLIMPHKDHTPLDPQWLRYTWDLPANNVVNFSRNSSTFISTHSVSGIVFKSSIATPFLYSFTVTPNYANWCSTSSCAATVAVCRAQLNLAVDPVSDKTGIGAVVPLSSDSDNRILVPIELKREPVAFTNGVVSLTLTFISHTNHVALWTDAQGRVPITLSAVDGQSPITMAKSWPANNYPEKIYLEGIATSSVPRDVICSMIYDTGVVPGAVPLPAGSTSCIVTDKLAITVMDVRIDAFDTTKTNAIPQHIKASYGLYMTRNLIDADADGMRDCLDDILNGVADTNDMALVVLRRIPGLCGYGNFTNAVLKIGSNVRLFRQNVSPGEMCFMSPGSTTNVTALITSGDICLLVEGATVGKGEITLSLQDDSGKVWFADKVVVNVLCAPPDTDADGLCEYNSGSLWQPATLAMEPVSFTPYTTFKLGEGALPCGLRVHGYLTTWLTTQTDPQTWRQNMYSLNTRVLPSINDGFVRVVRPNGRVVTFNEITGFPTIPDNSRTYRLLVNADGVPFTLVFASGYKHYFGADGALTSIESPTGARFHVEHENWPSHIGDPVTKVTSPCFGSLATTVTYSSNFVSKIFSDLAVVDLCCRENGCAITNFNGSLKNEIRLNKTDANKLTIVHDNLVTETWSIENRVTGYHDVRCLRQGCKETPVAQSDYLIDLGADRIIKVTNVGTNSLGAVALSSIYSLYPDKGNPAGAGKLAKIINPAGGVTAYEYDTLNRISAITSTLRSNTNIIDITNCERMVFNYDPLCDRDDNRAVDYAIPRTCAKYYEGQHVSTEYYVVGSDRHESQLSQNPIDPFDSPNNITTVTRYADPNGVFSGFMMSTTDPCGSVSSNELAYADGSVIVKSHVIGDPVNERTIIRFDKRGLLCSLSRGEADNEVIVATNTYNALGLKLETRYPDLRSDTYVYDSRGLCVSSVNREGVPSSFAYDSLMRMTNSLVNGVTTRYEKFDAFGNSWQISTFGTDTEVQTYRCTYDGANRLLSESAPFVAPVVYDSLINVADSAGSFYMSSQGNRTNAVEVYRDGTIASVGGSARHPVVYEYGISNGLRYQSETLFPEKTNSATPGARTFTRQQDAVGRQIRTLYSDGAASENHYDKNGRMICQVAANGITTYFEYDSAGRPICQFTDADQNGLLSVGDPATKWAYSYTKFNGAKVFKTELYQSVETNSLGFAKISCKMERLDGRGAWYIDAYTNIFSANVNYSDTTRTEKFVRSDGATATNKYVKGLLQNVQPFGFGEMATITSRDGFNRVTKMRMPGQGYINHEYALAGVDSNSFYKTTYANGNKVKYTLNQYGEIATITQSDLPEACFTYYPTGELNKRQGGAQPPMSLEYDGTGDLVALSLFRNFNASATPASAGGLEPPLSGGFDGPAATTRWEYDAARGWPIAKLFADHTRHTFSYDPAGLLTGYTSARGITTSLARDGAGRVQGQIFSDDTPAVTYQYDARSLPIKIADGAGERLNTWDLLGRPQRIAQSMPFGPTRTQFDYNYATNSSRCRGYTLALNGDTNVMHLSYGYNQAGKLADIVMVAPGIATQKFSYVWRDADVKLASLVLPNGVTNTYTYVTNATELSSIAVWPRTVDGCAPAQPLLRYDYLYDLAGCCTNLARPLESHFTRYAYESGQLVSAAISSSGQIYTAQWFYDTAGNCMVSSNDFNGVATVATHTYNALNQIRPVPSTAASLYDPDGNQRVTTGGWQHHWDAANRLTNSVNGAHQTVNTFDSDHRRVRKQVYADGALTADTTFVYDGWYLVAELTRTPTHTTTNLYVWGADRYGMHNETPGVASKDSSGGVRALLAIVASGSDKTPEVFYPVMNDHGDVMALLDATGSNIVARYEYDPWGNVLSATGPAADICPFRWQTKYFDNETGLYYFGYRFFDSLTGRWLTRDPIAENGGVNLYAFCNNDPVNGVDGLGLYVGLDDLVFTVGGALVGLGGQFVGDVIVSARSGSWRFSEWEDYAGSAVGGAFGGEALLYTGPVGAGFIGGATGNITRQFLKNRSGLQNGFSKESFIFESTVGAASGLIPGARISGVTIGRGSYNQIYRQIVTKVKKGTISSVKPATATKMFVGRAVDTGLLPGACLEGVAGTVGNPFMENK